MGGHGLSVSIHGYVGLQGIFEMLSLLMGMANDLRVTVEGLSILRFM